MAKSQKDLMNDLKRLNEIQTNFERDQRIVENDWKALDDQNETVKRITASNIVSDFEEIEKKEIVVPPKKKSWFNNLIDFLIK